MEQGIFAERQRLAKRRACGRRLGLDPVARGGAPGRRQLGGEANRALDCLPGALDPCAARAGGRASPAARHLTIEAAAIAQARLARRQRLADQQLAELLRQHLALPGLRQAPTQLAEPAPRPARRPRLEHVLPQLESGGEPPARHPQIVNRFAVVSRAQARGRGSEVGGEGAEALSHGAARVVGCGGTQRQQTRRAHAEDARLAWSSVSTRAHRSWEIASIEPVASRVWKPYSRDSPSSSWITRPW